MKICFYALREFDELEFCKKYSEEYNIDYVYTTEYPSRANVCLAEGCDAISTTPCDMSAEMVEAFNKVGVKYITCRSIGYDHVDLDKAKELGMRVSNVCYPSEGVADYAIMMMLMCLRNFSHVLKRSELQDYTLKGKIGHSLNTRTVGIIGMGRIGCTVARQLSGFGCRILAYDPYINEDMKGIVEYTDLDTLYANADIITLHTNATDENYHMICKESIDKMKDGVIIVNTSRGKLINSKELIKELVSGKVGAVALDVIENENGLYYYNNIGKVMDNMELAILRSMPNVILSPHTAFYTYENIADMLKGCYEAVEAFESGVPTFHEIHQ